MTLSTATDKPLERATAPVHTRNPYQPIKDFISNVSRFKIIESTLREGEQFANAFFDTGGYPTRYILIYSERTRTLTRLHRNQDQDVRHNLRPTERYCDVQGEESDMKWNETVPRPSTTLASITSN